MNKTRNKISVFVQHININKITEWLFYLFIFLLPWQTRWIFRDTLIGGEVFEYGRLSLYSFDILLFILVLLYCYTVIKNKRKLNLFPKILLVFLLYVFLSIIWSSNYLTTFYWAVRVIEGIILFWLVQNINFFKIRLAIIFVITAVIQSALGIFQFLVQTTFAAKFLGLSFLHASQLGPSVIELQSGRWLRAYGAFPHPNILGGFLLLAFIFLVYLFFNHTKHKNTQNTKTHKTQKHTKHKIIKSQKFFIPIFLYGSLVFINMGIFLSFSRAAWLGLFIVLLGLIIQQIRIYIKLKINKHQNHENVIPDLAYPKSGMALTGIILITWLILSVIYLPLFKTRLGIGEPQRLEVKSNLEHISSVQQSWDIIKTNPWVGVGMGNYTHYLKQQFPDQPVWWYQPVHNTYMLILAELGLVGFVILLLFNARLLIRLIISYKNSRLTNCQLLITFSCLLLIVYCLSLFDHYFWSNASMFLVIWLVYGLISKTTKISQLKPQS